MTNGAIRLCNSPSKHVHPDSENLPEHLEGIRSGPRPVDSEFSSLHEVLPPGNPRRHVAQRFVGNFEIHVATQTGERRSEAAITAPLHIQNPGRRAAFCRAETHFRITKLRALRDPVPRRPDAVRRAFRRNAGFLHVLLGAERNLRGHFPNCCMRRSCSTLTHGGGALPGGEARPKHTRKDNSIQ